MPERIKQIPDDVWNFLIKTLPFALAALAISISIQIKNKKANLISVVTSIIIGVSCAYLTGSFINKHFSADFAPILIGIITISGEKVGYWLLYKFKFDNIGDAIVENIKLWFKK